MVFSSIIFILFFLPVFLAVYYMVPRFARNYVILTFSIVFFAWGAPDFLPFLLVSCIVNFYFGLFIGKNPEKKIKRLLVGLSVAINLGLLFYFKYANFFLENIGFLRHLMGSPELSWERIVLPIGISFFTFQSITYTVDIFRTSIIPISRAALQNSGAAGT
jgi:alginate O-acetyltransferase complex protein AlgI